MSKRQATMLPCTRVVRTMNKCRLLLLGLVFVAGCGDSADSLLRTAGNRKSELTDRLMKVTDEPAAKKFFEVRLRAFLEKNKDINEKWEKWLKDIEDDFRSKKLRVVAVPNIAAAPGTEEWRRAADSAVVVDDARVAQTRDAFMAYMKVLAADKVRVARERTRLKELLNQLTAEKIREEKAKGIERPNVKAADLWPSLTELTDPKNYEAMGLTGSTKLP